jgi:anti-sigma regulatory factor (Ser/Thr protein kinase)
VALVVTQQVPTSSSMSVPHGPSGVGTARRRLRAELRDSGAAESVIDDAVLILSELLSNAYRHAKPLDGVDGGHVVNAAWSRSADGALTIAVTDGGGPTRSGRSCRPRTSGADGVTAYRVLGRYAR